MRLKKIAIIAMLIAFLLNSTKVFAAEDTFLDNNAISNITASSNSIVISEINTGKIISKKNDTKKFAVNKLPNYLAIYLLTNDIKNKKLDTSSTIKLVSSDETLTNNEISNEITVKDAIFFLEQGNSAAVLTSIFQHYNLTLDNANQIISSLSLSNSKLVDLKNTDENTSTARDIAYLTNIILKNYPEITDITKNPSFTLANEKKVDNNLKFLESEKFRVTGLNFDGKNSTTVAYSGNTKLSITILDQNSDKDKFFDDLQKTYMYLFENYNYKLALKAGTYKINNENITIDNDIYDLFYTKHSIRDITYLLMNKKILLFQKYETISANEGTVFETFTSQNNSGKFVKIKDKFINDINFDKKTNMEKATVFINRSRLFSAIALAIYSSIFIILYICKKLVGKE